MAAALPLVTATAPSSCIPLALNDTVSGSGASTPTLNSPAKSKPRKEPPQPCEEEMQGEAGSEAYPPPLTPTVDPIVAFPTTGQPVSDTMLKDMLLSLRASLQVGILTCINQHIAEIQERGDWVDHVENSLTKFTENYNTLVDSHTAQTEDITWIKAKLADLEERSRRNNLKIRGIPELVQSAQIPHFVRDLLLAVIPNFTSTDLTIDRIHQVPKPSFLPAEIPSNVILRIHFFQVKEQLLEAFHLPSQLPEKASGLRLLPDLSQYTLQQCKNLQTIMKALHNDNLPYKWKYLSKLEVTVPIKVPQ